MDIEDVDKMIEQAGDELMTPEQMARILTGNGDIPEAEGDDTLLAGDGKSEGEPAPAIEEEKVEAKPVILAKDGVHTIEYEKLVEARDGEQAAKNQARVLQEQLTAIQAERDELQAKITEAAQQDADTGSTVATDELLASFKEDYPEFYAVLQRETTQANSALMARLDAVEKIAGQLAPVIEKNQADAGEAHFKAIREGVEGYDQIVAQSEKVYAWISEQPKALREAYEDIVANSSNAQDVITVLNTFKAATGFTPAVVNAGAKKTGDIDKIIAAAKQAPKIPTSMSDIPASSSVPHDEVAAMLEKTAVGQMQAFHGKTPDQILDMMDRAV